MEGEFSQLLKRGRPWRGGLLELAGRHAGRRGWTYKSLDRKFRAYRRGGGLRRNYVNLEREERNRPRTLDLRGWTKEEFLLVLELEGQTMASWERRRGFGRKLLRGALSGERHGPKAAERLEAFMKWVAEVLRRRADSLEKPES